MRRLALVAVGLGLAAACSSFDSENPAATPMGDGGAPPGSDAATNTGNEAGPSPPALCTDPAKCPAKPLALKLPQIYGLTADADYIYAGSDGSPGRIYRIAKSDGAVITLSEGKGDNARLPVLHGSDVYFATDTGVYKVPKAGGGTVQVSSALETALTFAGDTLFGCRFDYSGLDVVRISSPDGGVTKVGHAAACESLWTNEKYLFIGGSPLMRVRIDGNDTAVTLGNYVARRVVADGDYAYSTAYLDGEVRRIKIENAPTNTSFETVAKYNDSATLSGDLTLDATHVYWTIGSGDGKVFRAPKAGGQPELIAEKLVNPYGIVVDDHDVYWSEHDKDILWVRQK